VTGRVTLLAQNNWFIAIFFPKVPFRDMWRKKTEGKWLITFSWKRTVKWSLEM